MISAEEFLSTICYSRDDVSRRSAQEFCLIYLSVPNSYNKPKTSLLKFGRKRHPTSVTPTIHRVSGFGEYNLIALVSYDRRLWITGSKYFRLFNILPFIIDASHHSEYREEIRNIMRDRYSIPRRSFQPLMEGEEDHYCQSNIPPEPVDNGYSSMYDSESSSSDELRSLSTTPGNRGTPIDKFVQQSVISTPVNSIGSILTNCVVNIDLIEESLIQSTIPINTIINDLIEDTTESDNNTAEDTTESDNTAEDDVVELKNLIDNSVVNPINNVVESDNSLTDPIEDITEDAVVEFDDPAHDESINQSVLLINQAVDIDNLEDIPLLDNKLIIPHDMSLPRLDAPPVNESSVNRSNRLISDNEIAIRQSAKFISGNQVNAQDKKNSKMQLKKSEENNDMTPRCNFYLAINDARLNGKYSIFHGRPRVGKTSVAKFCLDYRCIIVEDLDKDLRKFDPTLHDGIIFENIDFRKIGNNRVLQLICSPSRIIHCHDVDIQLTPNTQLIFTTSIADGMIFNKELRSVYKLCQILDIEEETFYEDSSDNDEVVVRTKVVNKRYV